MVLAAILAAWLQYADDGRPHARAVVSAPACPGLTVDGRDVRMTRRARPLEHFRDVVCDVAVPANARHVRIGDRVLPMPAHDPRRIVVLGDTGCRISGMVGTQSCNDPRAWPFPRIARAIARVRPDLVLHVGDYLYRESACPPLHPACAGSPYGDDAPAWFADFLGPAAPLFASAPVVLTRGNHESCWRSGKGWFRYLDPHATTSCSNYTAPFAIPLGDLRLVMFDSALAEDTRLVGEHDDVYRRQFAEVSTLARGASGSWFVTHRPPYLNRDERAAMGDALAPFALVLSGHLHFFAALDVRRYPPLIVNGEGGTVPDPDYIPFLGFATGRIQVVGRIFGLDGNGFAIYEKRGDGWAISLRDPDGIERARCSVEGRRVRCA
jgi:hypothetical protein